MIEPQFHIAIACKKWHRLTKLNQEGDALNAIKLTTSTEADVENSSDLLKRADVLGLLDIDPATLWRWRKSGNFPAPIKLTRGNLRWRKKDVTAWLESRRVSDVPHMLEGPK